MQRFSRLSKRKLLTGLATFGLMVASAHSQPLSLEVEIPRLNVAEYHSPYVAVWLQGPNREVTHIAVWYDVKMKDNEGQEWLKDLRQWWRRGGRSLDLPYDGLSSATKGPGKHVIAMDFNQEKLKQLAPGKYTLRVEASREVGGREIVDLPLTLPLQTDSLPLVESGKTELGQVRLMSSN